MKLAKGCFYCFLLLTLFLSACKSQPQPVIPEKASSPCYFTVFNESELKSVMVVNSSIVIMNKKGCYFDNEYGVPEGFSQITWKPLSSDLSKIKYCSKITQTSGGGGPVMTYSCYSQNSKIFSLTMVPSYPNWAMLDNSLIFDSLMANLGYKDNLEQIKQGTLIDNYTRRKLLCEEWEPNSQSAHDTWRTGAFGIYRDCDNLIIRFGTIKNGTNDNFFGNTMNMNPEIPPKSTWPKGATFVDWDIYLYPYNFSNK